VRQWLNEHPGVAGGIVAAVVALAVGVVVFQVLGARQKFPTRLPKAFYTVDDGKTFFEAGSENIAPFDHKGQQAVAAYVFECNGKRFVGYLERYTAGARQKLIAQKGTPQDQIYGRELKRPGDSTWVKSGDFAAVAKVSDVKCPDGHGMPEPVEP
jgi:hypothetical protein